MEIRDLFHPDSMRNPDGFRCIRVLDSALNVGSQPAKQPASQPETGRGTSHRDRYRFLTADRRETTGIGVGSGHA